MRRACRRACTANICGVSFCTTNSPRGGFSSRAGRSRCATSARRCSCWGPRHDHIAPWRSVYEIHVLSDADITFVLASGGHNAGVVSPPGLSGAPFLRSRAASPARIIVGPDEWLAQAERREGSWWPAWADWLDTHSAGQPGARARSVRRACRRSSRPRGAMSWSTERARPRVAPGDIDTEGGRRDAAIS